MKRKLLIVLAVLALLATALAAPATAGGKFKHPLVGDIDLELVLVECPSESEEPGSFLTWVGTVKIGKKMFGKAYFPTADNVEFPNGWSYFQEIWTIFKLPRGELTTDRLIAEACHPRKLLMQGTDHGLGSAETGWFATGEVDYGRRWLRHYVGGEIYWFGDFTSEITFLPGDTFSSKLFVFPPMD